jgi:elongation factor G
MADDVPLQPCLIDIAIEPRVGSDRERLRGALAELAAADRSLRVSVDEKFGQIVLKGTSELHLRSKIDDLARTYKIQTKTGAPRVACREKITQRAEVDYTHKKQTGGSGQFARVKIVAEPTEPGTPFTFENDIVGGTVPKEFIPGVEKGVKSVLGSGVLAGFPVVDLKVCLVDGDYHDVDSSALAFEIAAREALREALRKGASVLLEPIMKVEVIAPPDDMAAVLTDLTARRGQIQGQEVRETAYVIKALVPLASLLGYPSVLRELSQGRASFTMLFDHYSPMPDDDPPFRPAIGLRA